jgi:hypothetical protein
MSQPLRAPARRPFARALAILITVTSLTSGYCQRHQTLGTTQLQDWAALTANVGSIESSAFTASKQHLFGSQAFAVAVDGDGSPIISAARYGGGRVVAFGHEGMLAAGATGSLFKLISNAATWAAGKQPIKVAGSSGWGAEVAARLAQVSRITRELLAN